MGGSESAALRGIGCAKQGQSSTSAFSFLGHTTPASALLRLRYFLSKNRALRVLFCPLCFLLQKQEIRRWYTSRPCFRISDRITHNLLSGSESPGRSIAFVLLVKGHLLTITTYFECFFFFHRCPVITIVAYNLVFPKTSPSHCANHDQRFFTSTNQGHEAGFISLYHRLPHQRPHCSTVRGPGQATGPPG